MDQNDLVEANDPQNELNEHVDPLKCNACPKHFINIASAKSHRASIHGKTHPFMCKKCFYVFECSGDYYEHYTASHESDYQLRHKKNMQAKTPDPIPNVENDDGKIDGTDVIDLQELKLRSSSFMSPGISKNQPLHVVMVEPKSSKRSCFEQELIATILFTIAFGMMCPESVISRFEQRDHAVDSKGVAEYLRVLVVTDSIKEYVPDEQSGKPDTLPLLLQELKQCASGNMDESFMSPGISKKQPLHVVMVEPKSSNRSRFTQELIATILFTIAFGMMWFMAQSALSKYVGGLGGMGSSGVASSSSYSLKDLNREVMPEKGIILMAATNLPDILDSSLTRPGRFDKHIVVSNPDVRGRQEILVLYLQEKQSADDIDIKAIARGTPGFNGADLANLVNIAAIKAAVEGVEKLTATQLDFAKDRIMMGTERKTMFQTEEPKKLTAYHESGHAIVAFNTEAAYPIHKATILPRGSALGMVTQLPSDDQTSISKKQLLASLDVWGGRVAEELIFGKEHVTTRASDNFKAATKLANFMVSTYGMSDVIGPVYMKEQPGSEMQSRVDAEVGKFLREAYDRVKALLKKGKKLPKLFNEDPTVMEWRTALLGKTFSFSELECG